VETVPQVMNSSRLIVANGVRDLASIFRETQQRTRLNSGAERDLFTDRYARSSEVTSSRLYAGDPSVCLRVVAPVSMMRERLSACRVAAPPAPTEPDLWASHPALRGVGVGRTQSG
jgi:hypothetical protein